VSPNAVLGVLAHPQNSPNLTCVFLVAVLGGLTGATAGAVVLERPTSPEKEVASAEGLSAEPTDAIPLPTEAIPLPTPEEAYVREDMRYPGFTSGRPARDGVQHFKRWTHFCQTLIPASIHHEHDFSRALEPLAYFLKERLQFPMLNRVHDEHSSG